MKYCHRLKAAKESSLQSAGRVFLKGAKMWYSLLKESKLACSLASFTKSLMHATMSAKRLGTLPMIYAVDEQQNPHPHKTMLCGGDTNSLEGKMMSFQVAKGFSYQFNIA